MFPATLTVRAQVTWGEWQPVARKECLSCIFTLPDPGACCNSGFSSSSECSRRDSNPIVVPGTLVWILGAITLCEHCPPCCETNSCPTPSPTKSCGETSAVTYTVSSSAIVATEIGLDAEWIKGKIGASLGVTIGVSVTDTFSVSMGELQICNRVGMQSYVQMELGRTSTILHQWQSVGNWTSEPGCTPPCRTDGRIWKQLCHTSSSIGVANVLLVRGNRTVCLDKCKPGDCDQYAPPPLP